MTALPDFITADRVIAVARNQDATTAPALAEALRKGGLTTLEITVEGERGIEAVASVAGGPTRVGAGTVTTIDQASASVDAGATFLISPHLDVEILDWARARGVPLIPGVFTPTEIHTAVGKGALAVKLFPASLGGPDLVKALLAPYPDLAVVPTGGVDAGNILAYLQAGAAAVGVGGWLTGGTDLDEVTRRARVLASIVP